MGLTQLTNCKFVCLVTPVMLSLNSIKIKKELMIIRTIYRSKWLIGVILAAALLLAACAADTGAIQPDTGQPEEPANLSQESENQPQEEENQPQEEATQPEESDVQPEEIEAQPPPEFELGFERGSLQLKATDPESFVLAAGKPQLVELFAFW